MFPSGRHKLVAEEFVAVVTTIGSFLKGAQGKIRVTGHTDNVPVRSLKYPSNWELSQARADSVKEILISGSGSGSLVKIESRGYADTVNIVPNTSARNREINRRVEIQIFK
jgi:type VI secretion system protein ImpK